MLLVIFSESLGVAQNFATKYGYEINPNQELIALGVAVPGAYGDIGRHPDYERISGLLVLRVESQNDHSPISTR